MAARPQIAVKRTRTAHHAPRAPLPMTSPHLPTHPPAHLAPHPLIRNIQHPAHAPPDRTPLLARRGARELVSTRARNRDPASLRQGRRTQLCREIRGVQRGAERTETREKGGWGEGGVCRGEGQGGWGLGAGYEGGRGARGADGRRCGGGVGVGMGVGVVVGGRNDGRGGEDAPVFGG